MGANQLKLEYVAYDYNDDVEAQVADQAVAEAESVNNESQVDSENNSFGSGDVLLSSNIDLSKHKIIQRAFISFTTTDYEKSFQIIDAEVSAANGYIENANINGIKLVEYGDDGRTASIVIRVPAKNFESTLKNLRETDVVVLERRETENISSQYRDTQARLETIDIQIANLQQLLSQTKKLEDMLRLKEEISHLIYEKEGFQSNLQTWDDLVEYATIEVEILELNMIEPTIVYNNTDTYERSFGTQMNYAFQDAGTGFVIGLQNFLIWLAQHWVGVLFFIIFVIVIIVIVRKILKKEKQKSKEYIKSQEEIQKSKPELQVNENNETVLEEEKKDDNTPKTPPTA